MNSTNISEKENPSINFYINRNDTEGVKDIDKDIFPSHFTGLICGWPGSGKTSLLKFMLTHELLLKKKFDEILLMSPSVVEFKPLLLPSQNLSSSLDWDFIYKKFDKFNVLTEKLNLEYTNVLVIIDDFISELNRDKFSIQIKKLIFNRRHLVNKGMVSVLLTSQKYSLVRIHIYF